MFAFGLTVSSGFTAHWATVLAFVIGCCTSLYIALRLISLGNTLICMNVTGLAVIQRKELKRFLLWDEVAVVYIQSERAFAKDEMIILSKNVIDNPFGSDPMNPVTNRTAKLIKSDAILDWMHYSREKEAALRQFVPDKLRNWDQTLRANTALDNERKSTSSL